MLVDRMDQMTKFIYDNFTENSKFKARIDGVKVYRPSNNNLINGEKIFDEFNCAVQMKILIQGKMYISNAVAVSQ